MYSKQNINQKIILHWFKGLYVKYLRAVFFNSRKKIRFFIKILELRTQLQRSQQYDDDTGNSSMEYSLGLFLFVNDQKNFQEFV